MWYTFCVYIYVYFVYMYIYTKCMPHNTYVYIYTKCIPHNTYIYVYTKCIPQNNVYHTTTYTQNVCVHIYIHKMYTTQHIHIYIQKMYTTICIHKMYACHEYIYICGTFCVTKSIPHTTYSCVGILKIFCETYVFHKCVT